MLHNIQLYTIATEKYPNKKQYKMMFIDRTKEHNFTVIINRKQFFSLVTYLNFVETMKNTVQGTIFTYYNQKIGDVSNGHR